MPDDNKFEYIGDQQVFGIQREDYLSRSGGEVIKVLFEKGTSKIMTMKAYNKLVSDKPLDATTFRDKKFHLLLEEVVGVLTDFDISSLEVDVFLNVSLVPTLQAMFSKAALLSVTDKAYGAAALERWVPGTTDFSQYVTLLEADSVVRKLSQDESPTKPKPKSEDK